jgi:hypothetical protein
MDKAVFQIMYKALVDIAAAENFFDESKRLSQIAKTALHAIAQIQPGQEDK